MPRWQSRRRRTPDTAAQAAVGAGPAQGNGIRAPAVASHLVAGVGKNSRSNVAAVKGRNRNEAVPVTVLIAARSGAQILGHADPREKARLRRPIRRRSKRWVGTQLQWYKASKASKASKAA